MSFYYAHYVGKKEMTDDYGNNSGEFELVYGEPVKVFGNISAAQGEVQTRQFGESETYDKVIILDNPKTPIDEYSILWVDKTPDNESPHDYVVKKVARSLNSVSIAISKVTVNG